MKLFNTMTRRKEEFVPLEEGKVRMYVCGPTVYNLIHIGNARPMIVFDTARRYMEHKGGQWDDIRGTEVDVSLVKDNYILTGKIDLIQGRGNTVEIVDFKSTPKPNQYAERHILERYRRQLEIYAHLVEQRHGLEVSAMNLYYTGEESGVPTYRFPYERTSVSATIQEVDRLVGCMEARKFSVAERPAKLCKECDLKAYCDRSF
mgnify:CR=1 FL=1